MNAIGFIGDQVNRLSNTLEQWTKPNQNPFLYHVGSRVLFFVASEALALVAFTYHSLAILAKAIPATVRLLYRSLPEHLSWKQVYTDHISPLGQSLFVIVRVPLNMRCANQMKVAFKRLAHQSLGPSLSIEKGLWQTLNQHRSTIAAAAVFLCLTLTLKAKIPKVEQVAEKGFANFTISEEEDVSPVEHNHFSMRFADLTPSSASETGNRVEYCLNERDKYDAGVASLDLRRKYPVLESLFQALLSLGRLTDQWKKTDCSKLLESGKE